MNKRYQVFVSSTYADLKDERQKVFQTLMEMDCFPAGMEMFPAMDEEQWEFIKKVIDDCDYYLLVIGGRYGSTTEQGISFTEKEFDYAVEKNIKVIAFLHEEPDSIPAGKTDKNSELYLRLNEFRAKVSTGRLVKFWKTLDQLPGLVSLSLSRTIKTYPAIGWIRANAEADMSAIAEEVVRLSKENAQLRNQLLLDPQEDKILGLTFEEMCSVLKNKELFKFFYDQRLDFAKPAGASSRNEELISKFNDLALLGLVIRNENYTMPSRFLLTESGRIFLNKLVLGYSKGKIIPTEI